MRTKQDKNGNISGAKNCLGRRFALYIFIILLIVNICSLFYIYTVEKKRSLRTLQHQGSVLGQYIGTTVYRYILAYNYIALDEALDKVMSLTGLCYVGILADNEVFISVKVSSRTPDTLFSPAVSPSLVNKSDSLAIVKDMRERTIDRIDVSTPIIFADTYLGRVVIGLSMEVSKKETKEFLTMILIVNALVAIILGGGIYAFFWKRALQPINTLIEGANRVAQGNLEQPIPIVCKNELGLLTDSFNTMMTVLKQNGEEIQKKRQDWERLFNAVEDVVTIQDNSMRILQANAAAGRLLGKEPDELVGKHCYALFQQRTEPCPDCPVLQCLQDHTHHYADLDYPVLGKKIHVSAFPIYDEGQGWSGIAHIAKDVTEQKKLEIQYRQAQKMEAIGTLAGGIAHDFNNLLTPIMGYAQLIKFKAEAGSELEEQIDIVLHSSKLAQKLVKQILIFSREREYEVQEIQLQPIIKESMKLLRSSIPSSIDFTLTLDENCGNVRADATQIHQIIMNMCTNAYHSMERAGGTLAVTLQQSTLDTATARLKGDLAPGDYLELKISDTGIGMDALTRDRIFEPFFTTKGEGKGTGLGLSMVHGIIKGYGGTVSVYSEPGSGTSFTIYLPVVSSGEKSTRSPHNEENKLTFTQSNEHIMVVDDEEEIVSLTTQLLERTGYRVTTCVNGRQALEVFREDPFAFDLVITDITMPGITGLELAKQLIALRNDIPVIFCSGHDHALLEDLQKSGLTDNFIPKPINLKQLTELVREVLDAGRKCDA